MYSVLLYIHTNETEQIIMKAQNKAGTWFALKVLENGNALVYKLCSNYSSHVRGGVSKQWRCVQPKQRMTNPEFQKMVREGLSIEVAKNLFEKKLKGVQK